MTESNVIHYALNVEEFERMLNGESVEIDLGDTKIQMTLRAGDITEFDHRWLKKGRKRKC